VQVELGLVEERLTPPPSLLDLLIEKDYADDPAGAAGMRGIFEDPEALAELLAADVARTRRGELAVVRFAPPRHMREPGRRRSAPARPPPPSGRWPGSRARRPGSGGDGVAANRLRARWHAPRAN